ncbi:MAG: hypothetical protein R3314_04840 [Longimicrobiales bacterium]|nr:hypothetical protein [Longimicrobiales bacterium]
MAATVVGISACKDTTAPSLDYIRADITGAVEDTFRSGIQVTSWFHIRRGFDMYKISGFDTRTRYYSVGGTQVESRRGIFLMGLDRNAFPQGEVPLQLLDPEDSTSSGWVAIYTQDSLRFVSQRGFIRPTEVTAEAVMGTFEFDAFRYCVDEGTVRCTVPDQPPADAVWIEVVGRFRGEPPEADSTGS